MSTFEEYIRQGDPVRSIKAAAWQMAIGLQDVDGLIDTYYKSREGRLSEQETRTEEADKAQSDTNEVSKGQIGTLNVTLEELAVLKLLLKNPQMKQTDIAAKIGKSERTVKRITDSLKEKEAIIRRNGKRDGWWEVLVPIPEDCTKI